MADKKISELTSITGSATAADDYFVVVDTSGAVTYKISREELNNAIEQDVLSSIEITDITNDVNVQGTVTADGLTVDGEGIISSATTATDLSDPILQISGSGYTANGIYGIGFHYAPTASGTSPVFAGYQLTSGSLNTKGNLVFGTRDTTTAGDVPLIRQTIAPNGDISFYDSTGVTQGLFWDASAERLGVGTTTPAYKVEIFETGAGNAEFTGLSLTNYDYGAGETGQAVSIQGGVRNDGGGVSPLGKITFGKDSDYSSAANRDGNIQFSVNNSNSWNDAMRIHSDGDVSIISGYLYFGATSNQSQFVRGGGGSGTQLIVGSSSGGFYHQVGASYYLVSTTGGSTSDETLKENVTRITGAVDKIKQLNGVYFNFIEEPQDEANKGLQIGVIAQNIEQQFPEVVVTDDDGIKAVRYEKLIAPLIEAVKEQQETITALEARITALEAN